MMTSLGLPYVAHDAQRAHALPLEVPPVWPTRREGGADSAGSGAKTEIQSTMFTWSDSQTRHDTLLWDCHHRHCLHVSVTGVVD